jgi:hypothetical protein
MLSHDTVASANSTDTIWGGGESHNLRLTSDW